ncbi:MAG: hypothetical protein HYU02_01165 [Thaumarchaeota archaeon]|nr:hypothetical protein [Nitrososphaerota archaeon]
MVVAAIGVFFALPKAPQVRTIELEARDFGYNGVKGGPAIQIKVGETVGIVLNNAGGLPHEFKVVQDVKMSMAESMEPIFNGAATRVIKPGETDSITFVPTKAGKYFYGCFMDEGTKPDRHSDRGMFAEFIVQN